MDRKLPEHVLVRIDPMCSSTRRTDSTQRSHLSVQIFKLSIQNEIVSLCPQIHGHFHAQQDKGEDVTILEEVEMLVSDYDN